MTIDKIKEYIKCNFILGFKNNPFNAPLKSYMPIPLYFIIAIAIGFYSNLFTIGLLDSTLIYVLPIFLFFFPSLLEEAFFRGILIPINTKEKPTFKVLLYISLSTISFILWHPINALTINSTSISFFLNPFFLIITAFLGITCSISYIYSQSIWLPIIIHWTTVVIWVIFLGGINKILEVLNT